MFNKRLYILVIKLNINLQKTVSLKKMYIINEIILLIILYFVNNFKFAINISIFWQKSFFSNKKFFNKKILIMVKKNLVKLKIVKI